MREGSRSADRTTPALFRGRRAPGEDVASQSLRGVRTVSCACGRIGYRTGREGHRYPRKGPVSATTSAPWGAEWGENADDDMSEKRDRPSLRCLLNPYLCNCNIKTLSLSLSLSLGASD